MLEQVLGSHAQASEENEVFTSLNFRRTAETKTKRAKSLDTGKTIEDSICVTSGDTNFLFSPFYRLLKRITNEFHLVFLF